MAMNLKQINLLIKESKDQKSSTALLKLCEIFNPLIIGISERLYIRYNKKFSFDDIVLNAKQTFLYLILFEFDADGSAKFPHFIKQKLHAELTKYYRPQYYIKMISVSLNAKPRVINKHSVATMTNAAMGNEKRRVCNMIGRYIAKYLTDREAAILDDYINTNATRRTLADKYGISTTRLYQICNKCTGRLKRYLASMGIMRRDDI